MTCIHVKKPDSVFLARVHLGPLSVSTVQLEYTAMVVVNVGLIPGIDRPARISSARSNYCSMKTPNVNC